MRKIFLLITTLVAAFLFAGCSSPASSSGDTAYNKELELPHSESEWLFVLYMDADNNLNDTLWVDLYNVQSALSDMMNYDGTPKNGYPSVKIVALWDGVINHGLENQYINHSQAETYEIYRSNKESVLHRRGNTSNVSLVKKSNKICTMASL